MSRDIDKIFNNCIIMLGDTMITKLEQKVALEHLWAKKFKENGAYTIDMVPLTSKIEELQRELIVTD